VVVELITNRFPHNVSTIEGLVEVVKRENCKTVVIELHHIAKDSTATDLHYKLKFIATTPRGKRIVYEEEIFVRLRNNQEFAHSDDGRTKLLLLAEQRAEGLRESLPGVQINLMNPWA